VSEKPNPHYHFIVSATGEKLLDFLKEHIPHLSKKKIKELIERGFALVNHRQVTLASHILAKGEEIDFQEGTLQKAEEIPILYEDERLFIIDKPPFITSEEAANQVGRGYLVHRLDKETSGALLFAKDPIALAFLEGAFRKREVKKEYHCIIAGEIKWPKGTVRFPIGKKGTVHGQPVWGEKEGGASSVTDWERVDMKEGLSYLRVFPRTGRTHQIRVHLSGIGYPILGDKLYGANSQRDKLPKRLLLHAYRITIPDPQGENEISVMSDLPEEFQRWFSL
jgi:RluA family pseudouridine synthase